MKRLLLAAAGLLVAAGTLPVVNAVAGPEDDERTAVRKEYEAEKKPMFWDAGYYVDLEKLEDTRWTIPFKPPFQTLDPAQGGQLYATWSAATTADAEPAIRVVVEKQLHKSRKDSNTNNVFSRTFPNLGESVKIADWKKLHEKIYENWLKGAKEVEKKACKKPGKKGAGPAQVYAAVQGTDGKDGKRTRIEWYMWSTSNITWEIRVHYSAAILGEKDIVAKGMDFVKAIKETKKADLKRIEKAGK